MLTNISSQNIEDYISSGKGGNVTQQLRALCNYPNIPRKKPKFVNFVRNCLKIHDMSMIEKVWSVIEEANKKPEEKQKGQTNGNAGKRAHEEPTVSETDSKIQKTEQSKEEVVVFNGHSTGNIAVNGETPHMRFKWKHVILEILSKKDNQLPIRKLKKKVRYLM
jgi:cell growth-regulating nucleolar protein